MSGSYHDIREQLEIDYFRNCQFSIVESVYDDLPDSKKNAFSEAKRIMADESLKEELERIYSDKNEKRFFGNPVHYKITACSMSAAVDIIDILIPALYKNSRLLGSRATLIREIKEGCYDEEDLEQAFKVSQGTAIVIEMSGSTEAHQNYASAYEETVSFFSRMISRYAFNTLCIFVEISERPGFSKSLISRVQDDIDIIEIREGCGTASDAEEYLKYIVSQSKYANFDTDRLYESVKDKDRYRVSEVYAIFNKWYRNGLKETAYKAYDKCDAYAVRVEKVKDDAYERLQKMVGLNEIKVLVDQIISAYHIRLLRQKAGMNDERAAMHMVFTGNPGSAKTTVARLLAEILKTQGVLETGEYVECGRSSLVGKYVGWTAKNVRSKFRRARGGVLFIDEAYSLVDDSGSFGDEAINTIVQEMENHRDDVIVIFAGYPEKMKGFLDKNEGLRSRIAFHLNFPDYSPEELVDIIRLISDDRGYSLDVGVEDMCREYFKEACGTADFGNGRFARNLMEQATLRQAQRLYESKNGKNINQEELQLLKKVDFEDINVASLYSKRSRHKIGFELV